MFASPLITTPLPIREIETSFGLDPADGWKLSIVIVCALKALDMRKVFACSCEENLMSQDRLDAVARLDIAEVILFTQAVQAERRLQRLVEIPEGEGLEGQDAALAMPSLVDVTTKVHCCDDPLLHLGST